MHIAYEEPAMAIKPLQPRQSNRQWSLKPQDLAIAFKLLMLRSEWLPYSELGKQMHMSQFEAHAAAQRLVAARLANLEDGAVRPIRSLIHPFVFYGAVYMFPAVRTDITVGIPTAYGTSPLNEKVLFSGEFPPVWPSETGTVRGPGLLPLYENAPKAALEDNALYQLLALFDALRIGQAREKNLASDLLQERLR
jgi:hypothetical protein